MHDVERTANLLGATSLALTDRFLREATRERGLSTSSAAALVTLHADPGLSVSELGRRVGLSQPAAARMVDALEAHGLVERRHGTATQRRRRVHPTTQGHQLAHRVLDDRNDPLVHALSHLEESDQQVLAGLLEKILRQVHAEVGQGQRICRLCDRDRCLRSAPCPVGQAERGEGG
ncbi:MarR family winged helix-turn-helix transcriptional regulator [Brachybacterium sacelli]